MVKEQEISNAIIVILGMSVIQKENVLIVGVLFLAVIDVKKILEEIINVLNV